jgi:hypothetical protein
MIIRLFVFCIAALTLAGCNTSGIYPVSGKVTFTDGPMPEAEVAIIRFEPIEGTTKEGQTKPASGRIGPDGTYQLTTLNPDDGAFVGEYKVVFTIRKEYMGQGTLVDPKFTSASTTPHTAKVKAGRNRFDFEVTRAPGS